MVFSNKLRELRKQRGYDRQDLADILGIDKTVIINWESNLSKPNEEDFIRLSKLFSVPLNYLKNDDESLEQKQSTEENIENQQSTKLWFIPATIGLVFSIASLGLYVPFLINAFSEFISMYPPSEGYRGEYAFMNSFAFYQSLIFCVLYAIALISCIVGTSKALIRKTSISKYSIFVLAAVSGLVVISEVDYPGFHVSYIFYRLLIVSLVFILFAAFAQMKKISIKSIVLKLISFIASLFIVLAFYYGIVIYITNAYILLLTSAVIAVFGISLGMLICGKTKYAFIPAIIAIAASITTCILMKNQSPYYPLVIPYFITFMAFSCYAFVSAAVLSFTVFKTL